MWARGVSPQPRLTIRRRMKARKFRVSWRILRARGASPWFRSCSALNHIQLLEDLDGIVDLDPCLPELFNQWDRRGQVGGADREARVFALHRVGRGVGEVRVPTNLSTITLWEEPASRAGSYARALFQHCNAEVVLRSVRFKIFGYRWGCRRGCCCTFPRGGLDA